MSYLIDQKTGEPLIFDSVAPGAKPPKVSCAGCEHLFQRKLCSIKQIKVSRKKLHDCELFEAKQKKEPPKPVYIPSDYKARAKKARSFMRKLAAIGGRVAEDGTLLIGDSLKINADGSVEQRTSYEIPRTTAHASVIGTEPTNNPQLTDARDPQSEE